MCKRVSGAVEVQSLKKPFERKSSDVPYHLVSSLSGKIALPPGVKGYEVYTAQGRKIYQSSTGSGHGTASVTVSYPGIGNSVYLIRFVR
jgi:hypothetical protein